MGDLLKYRIPEQRIVQRYGVFESLNELENVSGFVVSSFDGDKFIFKEDELQPEIHYTSNVPLCVSQSEYSNQATQFLAGFSSGIAEKAILSRIKKVDLELPVDEFFNRLCQAYPKAFVYLISSSSFGTWIGATPEVLIERANEVYSTVALAGTKPSNSNVEWTKKEREEQQYVSDYIQQTLTRVGVDKVNVKGPSTVQSGPVEHLKSIFEFKLEQSQVTQLIDMLHPTPAVCGTPTDAAYRMINEVESHERSLYTGYIGVVGEESKVYVNLRCAQIIGNECFLYLGGGYTKDSKPENEWEETENKAKTLLNLLEKQ